MDHKETRNLRLYLLAGSLAIILLIFVGVLFDTQVSNYDYYLSQSVHTIALEEKVEASRGIITDRNGQTLVSNRSTYDLTFDSSLLKAGDDINTAILRLVELCRDQEISWEDNLPISQTVPFTYTISALSPMQKDRFLTYLKNLTLSKEALSAYLLQHPDVVETGGVSGSEDGAERTDAALQGDDLLEELSAEELTSSLLISAGLPADVLLAGMRKSLDIPDSFSDNEARLVLGIRYELALRKLVNTNAYVMAEDIDTAFISMLSDGGYSGAKVTSSSVREYETTYAAHILGTVGPIWEAELAALKEQGYQGDETIGKSGVELAFESYLRGTDGRRIVSTNSDGKITGEFYKTEPVPGNTVELTIDLDLQKTVEDALAKTVTQMNASSEDPDEAATRGAGAAVVKVGTGEVLSLASYPTFDLSTYYQDYSTVKDDPATPYLNRATQGTYAPGSTLKPLTAVAALEEHVIEPTQKLYSPRTWYYPNDPTHSYANCWYGGSHGLINVTQAITLSCNYFFAEMGYRLGLDTLNEYALAFGLGEHTGIEIGDSAGNLTENAAGQNLAPWAAFGQADYLFSPIQLANYIATLVSGGKHCEAHLLKAVKSYDNTEVLATGNCEPKNVVNISNSTLEAVKAGMLGYTQPGGMVYSSFKDCIVEAGAKTGTAQLGTNITNNGVFVCFAPYDDPEIAVAIVIEHGNSGSALASTAVEILNAYFASDESSAAVTSENQLLP